MVYLCPLVISLLSSLLSQILRWDLPALSWATVSTDGTANLHQGHPPAAAAEAAVTAYPIVWGAEVYWADAAAAYAAAAATCVQEGAVARVARRAAALAAEFPQRAAAKCIEVARRRDAPPGQQVVAAAAVVVVVVVEV